MTREEFIEKWGLRELVHLCADLDAVIAAEAFRPEAGAVEQQALDELRRRAAEVLKEVDEYLGHFAPLDAKRIRDLARDLLSDLEKAGVKP